MDSADLRTTLRVDPQILDNIGALPTLPTAVEARESIIIKKEGRNHYHNKKKKEGKGILNS